MLASVATFAAESNNGYKKKLDNLSISIQKTSAIAELYVNYNYAYFPINNAASLQMMQQAQKNYDAIEKQKSNFIVVTKDDYHYYFKCNNSTFEFLYAIKDNNIMLYDGFEYENEVKVPVGTQIFTFSMLNGRPVGLTFDNLLVAKN
jgi:hypothetical protein